MHATEGLSYLDAFYFMSMIAAAQGPTFMPVHTAGKLFAALMAFLSIGVVVAAVGYLFGPWLGTLWHAGIERFEEEVREIEQRRRH